MAISGKWALRGFFLPLLSLLLFPLYFVCVFSIYSKFSAKNIDSFFKQDSGIFKVVLNLH